MELNDILRLLFRQSDESYISVKENVLTLHVFKEWIYERGGWIEIEWNLYFEFLNQQTQKTQQKITEYLIN